MNDAHVSLGAWLKAGWEVFSSNFVTLLGGFLVLVLTQFIVGLVVGGISQILASAATVLIGGPLYVGWNLQVLRTVRGQSEGALTVFRGFDYFVPAVVASIIVGVIVMVGFALLIVPGLLVLALLCLWSYAVVDKNLSGVEAVTYSYKVTKEHLLTFVLLVLVGLGLTVVGLIPFGLGILVVAPWLTCTLAVAYEQLGGAGGPAASGDVDDVEEAPDA